MLLSAMGMIQNGDIVGWKPLPTGGVEFLIKTTSNLTIMVQMTSIEIAKIAELHAKSKS